MELKKRIRHFVGTKPIVADALFKIKGNVSGKLPEFMIIGIEKCGTTSLYNYLIQHPDISPPIQKEIFFFDKYYSKGINWYTGHFPATSQITCDATPTYYRNKKIAKRIKKVNPNAKFLMMLRDPVKRVYSAWNMCYVKGWDLRSIEKIIEDETPERPDGFLAQSRYVERIQDWKSIFPENPLHITILEDLEKEPQRELDKVFDFLKIKQYNIQTKIFNKGEYGVKIPKKIQGYLEDYFKPYNEKLKEYVGYNPWN